MFLDETAVRHLELVESSDPLRAGPTLFGVLDRCRTPMGARLLRWWMLHPSLDKKEIDARLDQVSDLKEVSQVRDTLQDLAREIANSTTDTCAAALEISKAIGNAVEYMQGVTGVHSTAQEAWAGRKGVCQDIAHLALGALRSVGIPARYVSGYLHPKPDAAIGETVRGESHAWVEWFCGGQWRGYDPTNLIDIGDRHVLVGRGRDYNDVPPLRGVYAGPFGSTLFVTVEITREA